MESPARVGAQLHLLPRRSARAEPSRARRAPLLPRTALQGAAADRRGPGDSPAKAERRALSSGGETERGPQFRRLQKAGSRGEALSGVLGVEGGGGGPCR